MDRASFDLATIEAWAYSSKLDEEFAKYEQDDPDWFELAVGNACPLKEQFRFAADPACQKRGFFAQLLVYQLCWIYRVDVDLPFHFSRFQGMVDRGSYLSRVKEQAEALYERAEIIEQMRTSSDAALQAFAKALLDHRHERLEPRQKDYVKLLRSVHLNVLPLFRNP